MAIDKDIDEDQKNKRSNRDRAINISDAPLPVGKYL
jgi:hypothetical protein